MPSNFEFLRSKDEYKLFADAAIDAENALAVSTSMTAYGARKAFELGVKWVYSADNSKCNHSVAFKFSNNVFK